MDYLLMGNRRVAAWRDIELLGLCLVLGFSPSIKGGCDFAFFLQCQQMNPPYQMRAVGSGQSTVHEPSIVQGRSTA